MDETNTDNLDNWRNIRDINYPTSLTDESLNDDVMGTYDEYGTNEKMGYQHMRYYEQNVKGTTSDKIQNQDLKM